MNRPSNNESRSTTNYRLNIRLLVASLIILLVLGGGGYLWYQFAFERSASGFLTRARALYDEAQPLLDSATADDQVAGGKRLADAFELYWQYIQIRPQDVEALQEFAERYDQAAFRGKSARRAAALFQRALTVGEVKPEYRTGLARNLIEIQEFAEAEEQALKVIQDGATNSGSEAGSTMLADAQKSLAFSLIGQVYRGSLKRPEEKTQKLGTEVGDVLTAAIAANPQDWRLGLSVAEFWLDEVGQPFVSKKQKEELAVAGKTLRDLAIATAEQVIQANADDAQALCQSYLFKRAANVDGGERDLEKSLELKPTDPLANALMGERMLEQIVADTNPLAQLELSAEQRTQLERARDHFLTVNADATTDLRVEAKLGQVYQMLGNAQAALETWKSGLGEQSIADFELLYRIVGYLVGEDRLDDAEAELKRWDDRISAEARSPNPDPKLLRTARVHRAYWQAQIQIGREQIDAARASIDYVLVNDSPDKLHSRLALAALGNWYGSKNLPGEAVRYFEDALALSPNDGTLVMAAARANAAAGNWLPAREQYAKLVSDNSESSLLLEYANVLLQVEALKSPEERNWQAFDRAMSRLNAQTARQPLVNPAILMQLVTAAETIKSEGNEVGQKATLVKQLETLEQIDSNEAAHLEQLINVAGALDDQARLTALLTDRIPTVEDIYARTVLEVNARVRRQVEGDLDAALQTLDASRAVVTDPGERLNLTLLRTRTLMVQGKAEQAISQLAAAIPEFSDSSLLVTELANLVIQVDRIAPQPESWEQELKKIEGQDGPLQLYFQARRKILQVEEAVKANPDRTPQEFTDLLKVLEEGMVIMDRVLVARSTWPKALEQIGYLHQLAYAVSSQIPGRRDLAELEKQKALANYRKALDQGGRDLTLVYRLVNLDDDPQQVKRVFELLDRRAVSQFSGLAARQADTAWQLNDMSMAETVANNLVESQPDDPISWLVMGQVKAKQGKLDEANQAAERARQQAMRRDSSKQDLLRVFQFYVTSSLWQQDDALRRQQIALASQMIESLAALELPEDRGFLKAQLFAAVGDSRAATFFAEAEANDPSEAQLRVILDYHLRNAGSIESLVNAIRVANSLIQKAPDNNDYKLQLASLLMRRGLGDDFDQAKVLLQKVAAPGTPEFNRAEAIRLVQIQNLLTNEERLKALSEAEALMQKVVEVTPNLEDQFLLAEIYLSKYRILEATAQPETAQELKERIAKLVDSLDKASSLNANQIANLANFYIEQGEFERAQRDLERLRSMTQTSSPPFAAPYLLQVRLWAAQEIPNLLDRTHALAQEFEKRMQQGELVYTAIQKSQLCTDMAVIYQEADDSTRALEWLRKAVEYNTGGVRQLILALAQNNQKTEAVNVAKALFEKNPDRELIKTLVLILGSGQTPPEALEAAQPMLDDALQKFGSDQDILMTMGDYYAFQPNSAQKAIEYYGKALALNDPDPFRRLTLLNNMATVFGEGDATMRAEALKAIRSAESMVSILPLGLQDTKAVVLMNNGDDEQARKILRSLVAADKDSRFWFHLAEVEWKFYEKTQSAADRSRFETAMRQALDGGVENTVLTPSELERLLRMKQNLKKVTTESAEQ